MAEPAPLQLTAADMRAALDRISDGLVGLDNEWRITFVNRAGAELLGGTPEDMRGRDIWDMFPEGRGGIHQRNFRLAMQTQELVAFERWVPRVERVFDWRAFPSPDGLTVIFRDVTEWRRLEREQQAALAELRQASVMRKKFQALVEASEDLIAIVDLERQRVEYVSPGGRRMLGIDEDVDIGRLPLTAFHDPAELDRIRQTVVPAMDATGGWSGEKTLRNLRTGKTIPVLATYYTIHDPDTGEPSAFATVQRDISDRLEAMRQLTSVAAHRRELMDRLVAAQEAERASIAADVHDDSVQALAAVELRLGMLQRRIADAAPQLNDQVRQLQATVAAATARLRHLLFDLEPPNPDETLAESLRAAAAHIFEGSRIDWAVDGDLDVALPDAERIQAIRIAKEALSNACQHADAVQVRTRLARVHGGVEISISDNGAGLDPEAATSPPGHRGLATMRDRAEVAGGWLRIERREPHGTTVRFYVPAVPG